MGLLDPNRYITHLYFITVGLLHTKDSAIDSVALKFTKCCNFPAGPKMKLTLLHMFTQFSHISKQQIVPDATLTCRLMLNSICLKEKAKSLNTNTLHYGHIHI